LLLPILDRLPPDSRAHLGHESIAFDFYLVGLCPFLAQYRVRDNFASVSADINPAHLFDIPSAYSSRPNPVRLWSRSVCGKDIAPTHTDGTTGSADVDAKTPGVGYLFPLA